jgi:hypothetical protein
MTRDEHLAEAEKRLLTQRNAQRVELARIQAARRTEARKQQARRRAQVGKLADEAGLLAWEDGVLRELFTLLAMLRDTPNPVAVLAGVLSDVEVEVGP